MIVDAFKILTEEDAAEYDADNMNEKIININDNDLDYIEYVDASGATDRNDGAWFYTDNRAGEGAYMNDAHICGNSSGGIGNYCEVTFTGTGITYLTERNNDMGEVKVYLDGEEQETVSCYKTGGRDSRYPVYSVSGLENKEHTLRLEKVSGQYMQKFLAKAKDVYNDPKADQAAVNGAAKDLEQAISDLEDVIVPGEVDKTELNRAIKQAESLKKELYTADSWDKMQEKLKAARDVYANPDADQPAVNLAAEELSEAIANLDLVNPPAEVDKSGLKDAVNRAETLKQDGYTDSSWRWFQSALEEAKAVLADSDATQAMVDSAEARLEAAMEDLEKTEAGSGGHTATGDWLVSGISILLAALALAGAGIVIFRRRKRDA